jgi:hypothetical protein
VDPGRSDRARPQSWNRYSYAAGNPLSYLDPDGREIHYANASDKKFYEKAAARNWRVRAVLDAFAPGTGRDLFVNRGAPGAHENGTPRAAVTTVTMGRQPSQQAMIEAYNAADKAAGGGEAGAQKGEAAANAVYETAKNDVTKAEITLGPGADSRAKLHELGHIEQALNDPVGFLRDAGEAAHAPTDIAYRASSSEIIAERFVVEAGVKNPKRPN